MKRRSIKLKKGKKEVSKTSQEPIREQKEFYTNEIENNDKESVNLEELSLEELEEMQKKLEVDGKKLDEEAIKRLKKNCIQSGKMLDIQYGRDKVKKSRERSC